MSQGHAGVEGFKPDVKIGQGNPEALKYGRLYQMPEYRRLAPRDTLVEQFMEVVRPKPDSHVLDLGCGLGMGGLGLLNAGMRVTMIDFIRPEVCLNPEVREALAEHGDRIRFIKTDLERGLPVSAEYGFCTDVMEHIPTANVDTVLGNILRATDSCFFSVCTRPDAGGKLIDEVLHLTQQPYAWWLQKFAQQRCEVRWSEHRGFDARFWVSHSR